MAVPHPVVEEGTPPPQPRPVAPLGRTPSPDEVRLKLAAVDAQLEEHREAIERVWGARDGALDRRLDGLERKLDGWAQTAIRNDQLLNTVVWPGLQSNIARTEEHRERIAVTERVADGVERLVDKLDGVVDRVRGVEAAQEALEARVENVEAAATKTTDRVERLERARAIADTTTKVRKQTARITSVRPWWWSSKGVTAVLVAVGTTVGGIIAAAQKGCL